MEQYYLEYSLAQGCFHIDTIEQVIQNNIERIIHKIDGGYYIIYGPNNYENCSRMRELYEKLLCSKN